jgi:hypothetical protein
MRDRIKVFVDSREVSLYRGMQVRHALIAFDCSLYDAAAKGFVYVEDDHGFRVGLEGSLYDGARLFTRRNENLSTDDPG